VPVMFTVVIVVTALVVIAKVAVLAMRLRSQMPEVSLR